MIPNHAVYQLTYTPIMASHHLRTILSTDFYDLQGSVDVVSPPLTTSEDRNDFCRLHPGLTSAFLLKCNQVTKHLYGRFLRRRYLLLPLGDVRLTSPSGTVLLYIDCIFRMFHPSTTKDYVYIGNVGLEPLPWLPMPVCKPLHLTPEMCGLRSHRLGLHR